jgi:pyocin large subunit-like protein
LVALGIALGIALVAPLVGCGGLGAAVAPAGGTSAAGQGADAGPAGTTSGSGVSGEAAAAAAPAAASVGAVAERIAREATWAPGQLQAHFEKHGREGAHATAPAYDASARETIRVGRRFTYRDRESRARRQGFYDVSSNRFTAVTEDGRRITTHFRPDNGERYVRGLPETTYR